MTDDHPPTPEDYARHDLADLVGYLLHLGLLLEDAKDVAGETMKRMCEHWANIENPRGWARTTAYRIAIDQARVRRSERDKIWRAGLHQSSWVTSADDLSILKDEQRKVVERIRQLPLKQRTVIALHLDGFSNPEIADIVGSKVATVASNLRHAKQQLAAILASEGVYRPGTRPHGRAREGGGISGSL